MERMLTGDTGDVDQNIDLLEMRCRLASQILEIFKLADIGGDADGINAVFFLDLFDRRIQRALRARGQNQIDAMLGQAKRDRLTNAAARPGYDRILSFYYRLCHHFPCTLAFYN